MKYILLALVLLLAACGHKPKPEIIIQTKIEYKIIPEEFLVCPATPVLSQEEIAAIVKEMQFNMSVVLPIFENNIQCYQNMKRIIEWNEFNKQLNVSVPANPS